MEEVNPGTVLDFMRELAVTAADRSLAHFRTALTVDDKGADRFDPVTAADREVETALRMAITARFPDHGIIGEEYGRSGVDSVWEWVIDPVDGTRAFVSGLPTWATLVALCERGRPRFGMMSQPYVGDVFLSDGKTSRWERGTQGRVLRASRVDRVEDATLFATTPDMFAGEEWNRFERLAGQARMRRFGADSYAYCMLAAGHVDLVAEAGLGFWDIAALVPLIEGAGGVVTDWAGAPVRQGGRVLAAANAALHARALAILEEESR